MLCKYTKYNFRIFVPTNIYNVVARNRIQNIAVDDSISLNDRLLGTELLTNITKNYRIGSILDLMKTKQSTSNTVLFDQIFGYTHGTWDTPITGDIIIDLDGAIDGACAMIIWSGSTTPNIDGVGYVLNKMQGSIDTAGTHTIYLHYINPTGVDGDGKFNINFFGSSGTTDTTAPVLSGFAVADSTPTRIDFTVSENWTASTVTGFALAGGKTISSITKVSSTSGYFTVSTAYVNGDGNDSISYTGGSNFIDSSSNALANFTATTVTNNVAAVGGDTTAPATPIISNVVDADLTAPTLNSITIENAAPTNVVMVFDESVTGTNLGFTIAGTTSTTFASISGSGTTWTGVLGTAAVFGETITLSYSSSTGDFVDTAGNALANITTQAVTNNVAAVGDTTPPATPIITSIT